MSLFAQQEKEALKELEATSDEEEVTATTEDPQEEEQAEKSAEEPEATEEPETTEEAEESEEQEVEWMPKGTKSDDEGNLVWEAGESVYKGRGENLGEKVDNLLENIQRGVTEKDRIIGESKVKLRPKKREAEEEPQRQFPEYKQILTDMAKKHGVDTQMLNWGKEQWRDYEDREGAVETLEARQTIKQLKQVAQREYDKVNIQSINDAILEQETKRVEALLKAHNISPTEFDYEAVIDRVYNDKQTNFTPEEMLESGAVVMEAANEVAKILQKRVRLETENTLKDKQAQKSLKKPKSTMSPASRSKVSTEERVEPPLTFKEAQERAREYAANLMNKK